VSKKKLPPKPEGYDELLGDLVDLIRQHQAKSTPIVTKKSVTKQPSAKKRKGGQP